MAVLEKSARLWLALFALPLVAVASATAQTAVPKEYQLKAAFLFNFTQFVEWPPEAFKASDAPFCIGILGSDPFGGALDQVVQGESIHGHKLVVRRSENVEELQDCQMVFISKSEKQRAGEVLAKLNGKPTLSVGEIDGFTSHGGIINFFLQGNRVRFEINPAAAQREGIRISSQLLSLGKISEP